jgi:hypothetical protein
VILAGFSRSGFYLKSSTVVREREIERGRGGIIRERDKASKGGIVCVCVRERERE